MEMGNKLGLVESHYLDLLRHKYISIQEGIKFLYSNTIRPCNINGMLTKNNSSPIGQNEFLANLLRRNEVSIKELFSLEIFDDNNFVNEIRNNEDVLNQIEIEIKYEGYIKRQNEQVEQFNRTEDLKIPVDFNYDRIKSISSEALDKLKKIKPLSIGQAGRIAGVRPSDISAVLIYMRG
jgi:tRNA uridine 5-carboxymethylaminomethyl modification enzyme